MNLIMQTPEEQINFRLDTLENEHGKNAVRQIVRLVVDKIPVNCLLARHVTNIMRSNDSYVLSKVFEDRGYL